MLLDPLPAAGGASTVNRSAPAALWHTQPLLATVVLATALAYALAALFPVFFGGQEPHHSTVWGLNVAAGVALAAALTYGRAALWGVALGAFMVQVGLAVWRSPDAAHIDPVLPALLALTAAVQASVGAALLHRFFPAPLRLQKWADILRAGLCGALLACAVGATVAIAALQAWGPLVAAGTTALPRHLPSQWPSLWLNFWVADSLGVLIVTPLVLAWIGQPRALWKARQASLALPVLVALVLLGAGNTLLQQNEEQHAVADFEANAARLAVQLEARLDTATHALQAVHGALRALPGDRLPSSETLWQTAQWWWMQPVGLQTVALALRESSATDKTGGEEAVELASEHTALRLRVPAPAATETLPSDLEAQAPSAARAGLQRARRHGEAEVLTEPLPGMGRSSASQVTLVQALYRGRAANDAARQALFSGYLLVSLDLQQTLAGLEKSKASALPWCLYDGANGAVGAAPLSAEDAGGNPKPPRLLANWTGRAGSAACAASDLANAAESVRHWQQILRLADRELLLQINEARPDSGGVAVGAAPSGLSTAVLQLGLCVVAALAALLLNLTGRDPLLEPSDLATPADSVEPGPGYAERIESGETPLKLEPLAVQPFLQDCLKQVHSSANDRGVLLSQPTPSEATHALTVRADRTRLTQVLTHLLNNAIQHNHRGGAVVVHAERVEEGIVELSVADTGTGMNPEQLAGLFEPNQPLGGKNNPLAGIGAGLDISRSQVEMMGGTLEVQSQAGVGSTFKLRLPELNRAQAAVTAATHPLLRVHYVQGPLVPDDAVRSTLEKHSQIELSTSSLGLDGLSAIRRLRPDLVLLNAKLPDINGLELLRHLKRDPTLAKTPVILVSAQASAETRKRAAALGALHCDINPQDADQFLAWVDDALNLQGRGQDSQRGHGQDDGQNNSQDRNQELSEV